MGRPLRRLGAMSAAALALGCAACSESMPSATAAVDAAGGDSYFVLGVEPHNMMLQIDQAEVSGGALVRFENVLPLHDYGQTEGDFVVAKVKGGSTYAVHSASIMAGHSIFGIRYVPIKSTLSFYVPPGKVVYVTNVAYSVAGGGLSPTFRNELQAAQDFVAIHYPGLAGKVEQGAFAEVTCRRSGCE